MENFPFSKYSFPEIRSFLKYIFAIGIVRKVPIGGRKYFVPWTKGQMEDILIFGKTYFSAGGST